MSKEFGKRIVSLMREQGLSVREGAKVAGIAASTLENWRTGSMPRNFEAVQKLAMHLGVSLSYLLIGREDGRLTRPIRLEEVLTDGGNIFEGLVEVKIRKMVHRSK